MQLELSQLTAWERTELFGDKYSRQGETYRSIPRTPFSFNVDTREIHLATGSSACRALDLYYGLCELFSDLDMMCDPCPISGYIPAGEVEVCGCLLINGTTIAAQARDVLIDKEKLHG